MKYHVSCAQCSLEEMIDDLEVVFDRQEEHQEQNDGTHILEFEVDI